MKKLKWILIALIACLVVAGGVLTAVLLIGSGGGNSSSDGGSDDDDEGDSEETVVADKAILENCKAFLSAYAALDGETAGSLLVGNGEPIEFNELSSALAKRVTVEYGKASMKSDYATVSVTIENVDLSVIMENLPSDIYSESDAKANLVETLNGETVAMKSYKATVTLVKQDGEWKVQMNTSLSDALMGGYFSMIDGMTGGEGSEVPEDSGNTDGSDDSDGDDGWNNWNDWN